MRVIIGSPIMVGASNRAKKSYSRYASASHEVLLNMPAAKKARTR